MVTLTTLSVLAAAISFLSLVQGATTVRINALGDSITGSPGCWRALLWQQLQSANVKNVDFVGTLNNGGSCGSSYDGDNDGHGGFSATGIVRDNQLPGWLSYSKPDIVMLQLGTNDVWSHLPAGTIITAFSKLVDQMRAQKSNMRILVAQITPMNPSGCSDCPGGVVNLNNAIAAWAPTKSTSASPITVVDCFTGYNTATDTSDGVHPNSNGNAKLAKCWYGPLKAAIALAGGGGPTTIPTTTTTKVGATTTKVQTQPAPGGSVPLYGQCGGQGYTGSTTCATGTCKYSNAWYSQCLQ